MKIIQKNFRKLGHGFDVLTKPCGFQGVVFSSGAGYVKTLWRAPVAPCPGIVRGFELQPPDRHAEYAQKSSLTRAPAQC